METIITEEERFALRRTLGLTGAMEPHRNHLVAGPGSREHPRCEALVARGLMLRHEGNTWSDGHPIYEATAEGKEIFWPMARL